MTDTTNIKPKFPPFHPYLLGLDFAKVTAWGRECFEAGAAHALAQMQGEPVALAATLRAEALKEFHRCDDAADVIEWYTERLATLASAQAQQEPIGEVVLYTPPPIINGNGGYQTFEPRPEVRWTPFVGMPPVGTKLYTAPPVQQGPA